MIRFVGLVWLFVLSAALGDELEDFVKAAREKHGEAGEKAAQFLVAGMPQNDRETLSAEFLTGQLDLAFQARREFVWARELPDEIFWNEVLPYASLDETREPWRSFFYPKCRELVKDAKTATEAAQAINRGIFNLIKVHYNTGRKKPNQSPAESITLGKATCTGLSIILVDACRSVGVPARVAGTALWSSKRGNHTWVEIYDGGQWHFTGADEYDAQGLNRGWFTEDASKAVAEKWQHAIWATSWKKTGRHFPMVWNLRNTEVPAVNVTARYVKEAAAREDVVYFRVWDFKGGQRIVATLNGETKTKAGTADLNDMAELAVKEGSEVTVSFDGETKTVVVPAGRTVDLYWDQLK